MMCYSIDPSDRIFAKGYGFLSFAKNMSKNIGKNLSGKYSQKLHHAKQFATDNLKLLQKEQFKNSRNNW